MNTDETPTRLSRAIPLGSTIPSDGLTLDMDWIPARQSPSFTNSFPPSPPPGFTLEEELGRGGMGVVYLGHQIGLNRPVAIKMLLSREPDNSRAIIRFLAEAEAVAAVRHPNVVEVYQFGTHLELPFLAMEYCPGGTLADWFESGFNFTIRNAVEMLAKVADGVDAAHRRGIVHRDLKPTNILLTAEGEPKVTDFGLAKLGHGSDMTKTGTIMGTPAYMSPEQARGDSKFIGPTGDVWSLGVILYELCTGKHPFEQGDSWSTLRRVGEGDFAKPRSVNRQLPYDLELIILKCMSYEPAQRYAHAGALATDLRNWLAGKPISARPASVLTSSVKWAWRNKLAAFSLSLAALALMVGAGVSGWKAWEANQAAEGERTQRNLAETRAEDLQKQKTTLQDQQAILEHQKSKLQEQNALTQKLRDEAEQTYITSLVQQGHTALKSGEPLEAASHYVTALEREANANRQQYLRQYIGTSLNRLPKLSWSARLAGPVRGAKFNPDGQTVLVYGDTNVAQIYDVRTGQVVGEPLKHDGPILGADYDPTGQRIATGSADRTARIWEAKTHKLLHTIKTPGPVQQVEFAAKGVELVTGGSFFPLRWDVASGLPLFDRSTQKVAVPTMALAKITSTLFRNGQYVAVEKDVTINVSQSMIVAPLSAEAPALSQFRSLGKLGWVSLLNPGQIQLYRPNQHESLQVLLNQNTGVVTHLAVDEKRGLLAYSNTQGEVRVLQKGSMPYSMSLWYPLQPQELFAQPVGVPLHQDGASYVEFSSDGHFLATAGMNRNAIISRLNIKKPLLPSIEMPPSKEPEPKAMPVPMTMPTPAPEVKRVEPPKPEGKPPESPKTELKIPDTKPKEAPKADEKPKAPEPKPMATPVVPRPGNEAFRLFVPEQGSKPPPTSPVPLPLPSVEPPQPPASQPPSTPSGPAGTGSTNTSAAPSVSSSATSWGMHSTPIDRTHRVLPHSHRVHRVTFSPNSKYVLTCSEDQTARLWLTETGEPLGPPLKHPSGVRWASWSADSQSVITGSEDGTIKCWSLAEFPRANQVLLHPDEVNVASYSPDGQWVLTACDDGLARLWKRSTGEAMAVKFDHMGLIRKALWLPDSRSFVTIGDNSQAFIWDATTGKVLKRLPHEDHTLEASLSTDGKLLVTVTRRGHARIWNVADGKQLMQARDPELGTGLEPSGEVAAARAVLDPKGEQLVLAGVASFLRIYEVKTGELKKTFTSPVGQVAAVEFHPDGKRLLVAGTKGVQLWDVVRDVALTPVLTNRPGLASAMYTVKFSKTGEFFASGAADGTTRVWNTSTGEPVSPVLQNGRYVHHVVFAPDGQRLLTVSNDSVRHWNFRTGELLEAPLTHGDEIVWAEYDANGEQVTTASRDRTVRLWNRAKPESRGVTELKAMLEQWSSTSVAVAAQSKPIEPLELKLGPQKAKEKPTQPTMPKKNDPEVLETMPREFPERIPTMPRQVPKLPETLPKK